MLSIGDKISILYKTDSPKAGDTIPITQSDDNYAIITNPDTLISITTVVNSVECNRKAFLSQRYARAGEFSAAKAILLGPILHETFQDAVRKNNFSRDFLEKTGYGKCTLNLLDHLLNETTTKKL